MTAVLTPTTAHPLAEYPTLQDIRAAAARLAGQVLETPVWRWQTGIVAEALQPSTEVWLKLELFQRTGTFKLRGALNTIATLDAAALQRGVVAASAGNHAMAVAYAARVAGTSAKVAMPRHASPARIAACRAQGAEVVLADSVHDAFARAQALVLEEGRTMMHPFDGPLTAQGTGTLGLEVMQQLPELDAVVVPVGGGGLCGGIAAAVKQLRPQCQVFGVEPFGADAMYRSFQAGTPQSLATVDTVADSLGAPYALPYSFGVCRRFVDEIVRVSDDELCQAMHHLFRDMKLVTEPAAATATAALLGPLRQRLDGRRVGLIVCGSNMDVPRYAELLARGAAA
ncbi:threonine ammonia-lyase [Eleftheria terrae]|uniref:threonine ammonia-lyase n=1 Tax=Eleftheria terrae TaxID=1597781 RepID=UPI00263AE2A7|nr:threonine/serine dehydratase [Eleftheria terrae]WKB53107.1 threonine/serine dehydratase [Eleftheria terrae]